MILNVLFFLGGFLASYVAGAALLEVFVRWRDERGTYPMPRTPEEFEAQLKDWKSKQRG